MSIWHEDKQLKTRAKSLLLQGLSYKQIADKLNEEFGYSLSRSAVRHACKYYFPEMAKQNVVTYMEKSGAVLWTEEMVELLKECYKTGTDYEKIAKTLSVGCGKDISADSVRMAINRYMPDDVVVKVNTRKADQAQKEGKTINIFKEIERDKAVTKLKMENQILNRKYSSVLKEQILQENILKIVRENLQALEPVPSPEKLVFSEDLEKSIEAAVLLISDTHIGEIVSAAETGGISQYDFATFQYRAQYLAEVVIDILKNKLTGYNISELVIPMLGDMVSGIIHDELVESAEDTVIEWVTGGALIFAQLLQELAQEYNIFCPCVVGNHGRMTQKIRFKRRYVNWDYVFYTMLSVMLKDQPNIRFEIPESFYTLQTIEGFNFLFLHGDNIRSWQGIPWYGIQRANDRMSELLNSKDKIIDYVIMGHFHNLGILDRVHGGQLILNGSFIGANEYSIGSLFRSNQPKQLLFGVHPRKGKTFSYDINLKNAPMNKGLRYQYKKHTSLSDQVRETVNYAKFNES